MKKLSRKKENRVHQNREGIPAEALSVVAKTVGVAC